MAIYFIYNKYSTHKTEILLRYTSFKLECYEIIIPEEGE